jgi:FKBP-type peptidyl-prolyl cis-trans isomerase
MSDKSTSSSKRRGQAIAGVLSGVLVFVVLVVVFVLVRQEKKGTAEPVPAAAPTAVAPETMNDEPVITTGSGTLTDLVIKERIPGTGPVVKAGQTISVNYKLVGYTSGEEIDSSWKGGKSEPISFQIGTGQLIQGWDKGIPGQKVGSRIQLDVPAALAYGPEKGDLRFVVDILSAE